MVVRTTFDTPPDLAMLSAADWHLELPGTCSPTHFRRIGFERAGAFAVDLRKLHERFPNLRSGDSQAIRDISIANRLSAIDARNPRSLLRHADRVFSIEALRS